MLLCLLLLHLASGAYVPSYDNGDYVAKLFKDPTSEADSVVRDMAEHVVREQKSRAANLAEDFLRIKLGGEDTCFAYKTCYAMTLTDHQPRLADVLKHVEMTFSDTLPEESQDFPVLRHLRSALVVGKATKDPAMCARAFPGCGVADASVPRSRASLFCRLNGNVCPVVAVTCGMCGITGSDICGGICPYTAIYCGTMGHACSAGNEETTESPITTTARPEEETTPATDFTTTNAPDPTTTDASEPAPPTTDAPTPEPPITDAPATDTAVTDAPTPDPTATDAPGPATTEAPVPGTTIPPQECLIDFVKIHDACWHVGPQTMNQEDATAYCQNIGGYLAEIRSLEEYQALLDHPAITADFSVWISATDKDQEGTFIWQRTGEPVAQDNGFAQNQQPPWSSAFDGSPSIDTNANCVEAIVSFDSLESWDDVQCTYTDVNPLCKSEVLLIP